METIEVVLPAIWASYLINGDCSGLEQEDIDLCDGATAGMGSCVCVLEYSWFGVYKGIGYDLTTYTFRPNNN
jgi:hypothetical protein